MLPGTAFDSEITHNAISYLYLEQAFTYVVWANFHRYAFHSSYQRYLT